MGTFSANQFSALDPHPPVSYVICVVLSLHALSETFHPSKIVRLLEEHKYKSKKDCRIHYLFQGRSKQKQIIFIYFTLHCRV